MQQPEGRGVHTSGFMTTTPVNTRIPCSSVEGNLKGLLLSSDTAVAPVLAKKRRDPITKFQAILIERNCFWGFMSSPQFLPPTRITLLLTLFNWAPSHKLLASAFLLGPLHKKSRKGSEALVLEVPRNKIFLTMKHETVSS